MDYFGDYFNVYRRVARAVHGDLLIADKHDLNNTLFSMICYYYQMENVHAYYGISNEVSDMYNIRYLMQISKG